MLPLQVEEDRLDVEFKILKALITQVTVLLQRPGHDMFKVRRRFGAEIAQGRRGGVNNVVDQCLGCRRLERMPSRQKFVAEDAVRKNVTKSVSGEPLELFGRHVSEGANDVSLRREPRRNRLGQ